MRDAPIARTSAAFGPYAASTQHAETWPGASPAARPHTVFDNAVPYEQETAYEQDADWEPAWEISPEDRVGPPLRRRRTWLKRLMLVTVAAGGAWTWYTGPPEIIARWLPADLASLTASLDFRFFSAAPSKIARAPEPIATAPEPLPTTAYAEPQAPVPPPATPRNEANTTAPPAGAADAPMPPAPYAPPKAPAASQDINAPAPPGDPLRAKAEAVGLHPDLSRVLLLRLSETDYRNAGIAVRKALAADAADAVIVWPKRRTADVAQFKVRFVPTGTANCRRYVVAIAKDGWLTTALPVETCRRGQASRPG